MTNLVPAYRSPALPPLIAAAGDRAGMRFREFFAANIRNPHTRRAYARAAEEFLTTERGGRPAECRLDHYWQPTRSSFTPA